MVSFRKSKKFGPFRFGVSKRGVSGSVGAGGVRVSKGADGKVRRTVGIPGTGVYDTKTIGGKKQRKAPKTDRLTLPEPSGPPLTAGQVDHLRRELERAGVAIDELDTLTLGEGEYLLDVFECEQFYVTQERRAADDT